MFRFYLYDYIKLTKSENSYIRQRLKHSKYVKRKSLSLNELTFIIVVQNFIQIWGCLCMCPKRSWMEEGPISLSESQTKTIVGFIMKLFQTIIYDALMYLIKFNSWYTCMFKRIRLISLDSDFEFLVTKRC